MALITSRSTTWQLVPKWARGLNFFRLLYVFAVIFDAMTDWLLVAIRIRFVGLYSPEAAQRLALERLIFLAPNEDTDTRAMRLAAWWDVNKRAGDFLTMARSIQEYFYPDTPMIEIVSNDGTCHRLARNGTWTIFATRWDWDGHGAATHWSRFWVLISPYSPGVTGTTRAVLQPGATLLQASHMVGSDTPYLNRALEPTPDPRAIRAIEEARRPPHCHCDSILLLLDHEAFWDAFNIPAGNWQYWRNRNPYALYWAGTPGTLGDLI